MFVVDVYGCERLCFCVGYVSVTARRSPVVPKAAYRSFTPLSASSAQSQFHIGIQSLYRLLICNPGWIERLLIMDEWIPTFA